MSCKNDTIIIGIFFKKKRRARGRALSHETIIRYRYTTRRRRRRGAPRTIYRHIARQAAALPPVSSWQNRGDEAGDDFKAEVSSLARSSHSIPLSIDPDTALARISCRFCLILAGQSEEPPLPIRQDLGTISPLTSAARSFFWP